MTIITLLLRTFTELCATLAADLAKVIAVMRWRKRLLRRLRERRRF